MARSKYVYVLTPWDGGLPIAAFTVKRDMHSYADRHGLYNHATRVSLIRDGGGGAVKDYLLKREN